jgi:hypothetical protein
MAHDAAYVSNDSLYFLNWITIRIVMISDASWKYKVAVEEIDPKLMNREDSSWQVLGWSFPRRAWALFSNHFDKQNQQRTDIWS